MGASCSLKKEDRAKSISKRLSNLARRKGIPYRNILMSFYIECLLARVTSRGDLKDHLIFKGGYVGLRVYDLQRYTIDLDAVITKGDCSSILEKVNLAIVSDLGDGTWFKFKERKSLLHQVEYKGFRLVYRAGLGKMPGDTSRCDIIHFDVGVGDVVVPGPVSTQTQSMLDYKALSWEVYPIESIISEKIHALIVRGGYSSRSKDIFDLAFYLPKADSKLLREAIHACFKRRKTRLPKNIHKTISSYDFKLIKKGWSKATSSLSEEVDFDNYLQIILNEIKLKIDS